MLVFKMLQHMMLQFEGHLANGTKEGSHILVYSLDVTHHILLVTDDAAAKTTFYRGGIQLVPHTPCLASRFPP